jgi:hypothetical protein
MLPELNTQPGDVQPVVMPCMSQCLFLDGTRTAVAVGIMPALSATAAVSSAVIAACCALAG